MISSPNIMRFSDTTSNSIKSRRFGVNAAPRSGMDARVLLRHSRIGHHAQFSLLFTGLRL
jgi:hypothetical protein